MLTKNIEFKNFRLSKNNSKIKKKLKKILKQISTENNQIISSLKKSYKDSYNRKILFKLKKVKEITLIGMGGSILGAKAIYNFLNSKSKKFIFKDSFTEKFIQNGNKSKKLNLVISKSGNTLETISNSNIIISKRNINIFLSENKKNYLTNLANRLKSQIIHHNNFIGGRYSVLSEVGMLPAELMGYKPEKFRCFNNLIKNKQFINSLISNVSNTLKLIKAKKTNSIILNYDERSLDLLNWYQQLVAESLGKNKKGIFPVISNMPRDNHSLMQYYLDGTRNNFFTFFFVNRNSPKIKNQNLLNSHFYLKNKSLSDISYSQFIASQKVFFKKKIPYRSFEIQKINEQSLGELFTFFILETIILGKAMNINPFDQPAVELIKKETNKILINS